jgi:hypothetical protein
MSTYVIEAGRVQRRAAKHAQQVSPAEGWRRRVEAKGIAALDHWAVQATGSGPFRDVVYVHNRSIPNSPVHSALHYDK